MRVDDLTEPGRQGRGGWDLKHLTLSLEGYQRLVVGQAEGRMREVREVEGSRQIGGQEYYYRLRGAE